ncbi:unnamed protein product [Penicillium salamii]|uniref:O-methyltransferase domain-containing protein n=1 Tax=Penicillium salamii TaxID=1612424 RepID=A0A9W4INK6_9EURO|nr:unnamed protein product [Penicillium salamii]CAG8011748.1 unnamed protein product [Penicillium salamii]CAG8069288.1 unnamed protein product [Penicillium salamii]CAG8253154.1 unnamed protein product [Penicillium salamii]CAG8311809.1 unnamed protein product [Penicillium salamii]
MHLEPIMIRVGLDLNLFHIFSEEGGPLSVAEIADRVGAAPTLTGRILRYLNSVGVISETSKDHFEANNITLSLSDPGVRSAIYHNSMNVGPIAMALPEFLAKHKYQDITSPTATAFGLAYNTELPAFIWLQSEPERFSHFNRYMQAEETGLQPWLETYPIEEKSLNLEPEQIFFVDVGGGIGHQAVGVKKWMPQIVNQIIVQDQEVVVPHAIQQNGVKAMAHDFFQPQPIQGARIYYMRRIIHDWPDEKAAEILKNTKAALGPDSVILIDDMVLPNAGVHWYGTVLDMTMMAGLAAQERTEEQWNSLMEMAGLKIQKVYTYTSFYNSILECVPVA